MAVVARPAQPHKVVIARPAQRAVAISYPDGLRPCRLAAARDCFVALRAPRSDDGGVIARPARHPMVAIARPAQRHKVVIARPARHPMVVIARPAQRHKVVIARPAQRAVAISHCGGLRPCRLAAARDCFVALRAPRSDDGGVIARPARHPMVAIARPAQRTVAISHCGGLRP
jgi:hypothetical protein